MALAQEQEGRHLASDASMRYYLALVSNGSLTAESFEKMQQAAREAYHDFLGTLRPWEGRSYVEQLAREFKDARAAFIAAFGTDPLDPAFKAWEKQRIADIEAGKFDTVDTEAAEEKMILERLRKRTLRSRKER